MFFAFLTTCHFTFLFSFSIASVIGYLFDQTLTDFLFSRASRAEERGRKIERVYILHVFEGKTIGQKRNSDKFSTQVF